LSRVFSLQVSDGGVPKLAVREAMVTRLGLADDRQNNLKYHGGPDRAVCFYSLELIQALQLEGHRVFPGALGENVTLVGLDWAQMQPGARLRLGPVVVELTKFATPCSTIAQAFANGEFMRVSQKVHPGWSRVYCRVLEPGLLRVIDEVVLEPPSP
jgi:MOSC domain-containing protein YiiM